MTLWIGYMIISLQFIFFFSKNLFSEHNLKYTLYVSLKILGGYVDSERPKKACGLCILYFYVCILGECVWFCSCIYNESWRSNRLKFSGHYSVITEIV